MFSALTQTSVELKVAWVLLMYFFVNSVFATFLNASQTPCMVRAFNNQEHYVALTSYGGLVTMIAVVILNISFPMLMANLATSASGWKKLIAIYAISLTVIGMLRFIFIKEEYNVDVKRIPYI